MIVAASTAEKFAAIKDKHHRRNTSEEEEDDDEHEGRMRCVVFGASPPNSNQSAIQPSIHGKGTNYMGPPLPLLVAPTSRLVCSVLFISI